MAANGPKGWIELRGGAFGASGKGDKTGPLQQTENRWGKAGKERLALTVNLPARGVWYAWLKVSTGGPWPALLTWDVDGEQPLVSARREILVQPWQDGAWVNHTRFPDFKIEVHVDRPGKHVVTFALVSGRARIDKVLLTLHHSARRKGEGLDVSEDPARGRLAFPSSTLAADGARPDWAPPAPVITGTAYHVDAEGGDDAKDGTSPATAWKTLGPVNGRTFQPGDAILLKRGGRWRTGLSPKGSGTKDRPITLGAYGEGAKPFVNGINRPGLHLVDQSWWTVQDLQAVSDPEYRKSAIFAEVTEHAERPKGLRILNCDGFDSGSHGIEVGGYAGYDGVVVENCRAFDNLQDGIKIHGLTQVSGRNAVVRHCTAWSNPGMAGIWILGWQNGLIEDCLAYNNACVNIWCWNAVNVTMRRCEAFRGRPQRDAAGFDIDWGSEACTLEYCYSHDNEGDAFLLMGSGNVEYLGYPKKSAYGVMRYCVAEGQSVIDMGETFDFGLVYNNVAVANGKGAHAFKVFGWPNDASGDGGNWPTGTKVLNNILIARQGANAIYVDDHGTEQENVYDWNLLAGDGKAPLILWGGRANGPGFWDGDKETGTFPPKKFATLKAFQKATGLGLNSKEGDPKLAKPGAGEYGRLPLDGYAIKKSSPAAGAGAKVALTPEWLAARRKFLTDTGAEAWGIPMEPAPDPADWTGRPSQSLPHPSIGAREP